MSGALVAELAAGLPGNGLVSDPDVLDAYRRDQTPFLDAGRPLAACLPTTTAEVAHVLATSAAHGVPVVTRGAGSGLAGGANAIDGCIVLVTTRMDEIVRIDQGDQYAVVQPGVLNQTLKERCREVGLMYPPDPASAAFSTLGGNIATNAGGLCCVKYGVTRDYVLGLEVVLADGTVVRAGRRTPKGVAGYDLTALFVGSEGTLGVVTEATLRLRPLPSATPSTGVALFSSLREAGNAVVGIARAGVVPSLLELMDRTTIMAVDAWQHMELDVEAAALLLVQSDQPGRHASEDVGTVARVCEEAGATFVATTDDVDEGEMLLAARRFAYPALERLGATLLDDVAVPRTRIPDLLDGIEGVAHRFGITIGTFGHAGDGNFHPTLVYDREDEAGAAGAVAAFDAIVELALALGGTVTGEHGVGLLKRRHLAMELSPGAASLHAAIKRALDPGSQLNPGKALPVLPP